MLNRIFKTVFLSISLIGSLFIIHSCNKVEKAYINENEFRDKVYACWLGKNIGGTLGMPFEGDTGIHEITYYTNIKEGEPAANDDLDLQILWLKAMQENNAHVDAFILGQYWLKYVPVNWNEYGVGKANMLTGLMPPVSGEYNNARWKNSNGAWIRSEIWACLYPGHPLSAAKMAREDACVDHGMAEGTYAEIFTASIESAAFVESDRDSLIRFGLSMIPHDCRVARAVRTAVQSRKEGKDWKEARMAVIMDTKDMGWFQAPRNVAFTMIGWLYGEGDFGKSICIAINCGDDTDCTGATLGSIFGIIGGTNAIPEIWRKPVGKRISNVAISGFEAPSTLDILTDSTIKMTRKVLAQNSLPLIIGPGKSNLQPLKTQMKPDSIALKKLWTLSPWKVVRHNREWVITFDYLQEPYIMENEERNIILSVSNVTGNDNSYKLSIKGLPGTWKLKGLPADTIAVEKESKRTLKLTFFSEKITSDTTRLNLLLTHGEVSDNIPFSLFSKKN